jgi:hypothetical protein
VKEAEICLESRRLKQSVVMRRIFALIQWFIFTDAANRFLVCEMSRTHHNTDRVPVAGISRLLGNDLMGANPNTRVLKFLMFLIS